MEMPQPTDAHRRLDRFAGSWAGEEIMYPSPWDPQGGKATGRSTSRVALGGFAVLGDYEQERNGAITFTGHAVYTYDAMQQCYLLHWWDCMGTPVNVFRGNFDGDVLRLTCSGPEGHMRLSYDLSRPDQLHSRMDTSMDGRQWSTLMEGTYARQG